MDPTQMTFFLQVCDSGFPNGSFAHSFGLETLIEEGVVKDEDAFRQTLGDWFRRQLIPFEGLAAHIAWEYANSMDFGRLADLGELVVISTVATQTRQGMQNVGRRTITEVARMMPGGFVAEYANRVAVGEAKTTFAIALAVAAADMGIAHEEVVTAVLYSSLSTTIGTAVRTVPLGQTAGQRLLLEARGWLGEIPNYSGMTADDLSSAVPLWEIAQMNHEWHGGRLFMS